MPRTYIIQGNTGINNMFKSQLSTYHFPKKTTPLTVYLMPVHCVILIPSPELDSVITLSLPSVSAHLPHSACLISEMSLESGHSFHFHCYNPGFISYLDHQSFFPDSSLPSTMPAEILSCKTNLIMLLYCLSTLFGSFFLSRIKAKFLSLTQPFRDQPDLSSHCCFPPFPLTNLMF